ncbi:hypothetical protein HB770_34070 (plasmid) [Rhizobium leguminosarum bv. viciae]|uniref:Uncharacterized protein n=1 Tax=Rhizobium leguminosarum bv. viciae TaxID=387 RepID=A0A7G6RNZ7_RHILV|nr:hypothetical protein HB770_34070 [Rhizobium leguminosarum bv. viciae]
MAWNVQIRDRGVRRGLKYVCLAALATIGAIPLPFVAGRASSPLNANGASKRSCVTALRGVVSRCRHHATSARQRLSVAEALKHLSKFDVLLKQMLGQ